MEDDSIRTESTPASCVSCRKKKAKCDRAQPSCSNCTRLGRSCSYESIWRTPLTRKHLSSVEDELARYKALLRRYQNRSSSAAINGSSSGDGVQDQASESLQEQRYDPLTPTQALPLDSEIQQTVHPVQPQGSNQIQHRRTTSAHSKSTPAFSLETPPTLADLDWDERAGTDIRRQFVDGMASLTEQSARGYMGVASGAAFLRLADGDTNELGGGVEAHDNVDNTDTTPPLLPTLYSSAHLEPLVDAYFQTYHISYPIIHEATFRAQFMEIIPRPKGPSWPVLLYIVAAIGAFAASEVAPEVDQGLFEVAKSRMTFDLLETGNLILVQALTLASNYVQKRNKPNSGYNYLGLAKRMALGIGLHKEFPAWQSKPFALELRRRIWYCMFVFDAGAIITFSRPLDLPKGGVEVQLPLNISDSDITASTQTFPPNRQQTTLYTHVRCQTTFHLATLNIYERLITAQPTAEEMLSLDSKYLTKWLDELPPWFKEGANQPQLKYRFSHAKLQWRWRNFRILMYRPYLIQRYISHSQRPASCRTQLAPTSPEERAIQHCLTASSESIRLITAYWRSEVQNVLVCWYSLYFIFQAVMIPAICLRNDPASSSALDQRDLILDALDVIADMSRLNSAAQRCHNAITKLCGGYLTHDLAQQISPVHESPHTQLNTLYDFMWSMSDSQNISGLDWPFQAVGWPGTATLDFTQSFNDG